MKKKGRGKQKKLQRKGALINLHLKSKERRNLQEMPFYKLKGMRNWLNLKLTVMQLLLGLLKLKNNTILQLRKDSKLLMRKQRLKQILKSLKLPLREPKKLRRKLWQSKRRPKRQLLNGKNKLLKQKRRLQLT